MKNRFDLGHQFLTHRAQILDRHHRRTLAVIEFHEELGLALPPAIDRRPARTWSERHRFDGEAAIATLIEYGYRGVNDSGVSGGVADVTGEGSQSRSLRHSGDALILAMAGACIRRADAFTI